MAFLSTTNTTRVIGQVNQSEDYDTAYSRNTQWSSENSNMLFSFASGIYNLRDKESNSEFCLNPSTKTSGVKYSTWENYLYNQSTGEMVKYENPGFYLKSNLSNQTVGEVSS